jgi:hypothetical protein
MFWPRLLKFWEVLILGDISLTKYVKKNLILTLFKDLILAIIFEKDN